MTEDSAESVAVLTELHAAVERFRWSLEDQDIDPVKFCLIGAEEALLRARGALCNEHA